MQIFRYVLFPFPVEGAIFNFFNTNRWTMANAAQNGNSIFPIGHHFWRGSRPILQGTPRNPGGAEVFIFSALGCISNNSPCLESIENRRFPWWNSWMVFMVSKILHQVFCIKPMVSDLSNSPETGHLPLRRPIGVRFAGTHLAMGHWRSGELYTFFSLSLSVPNFPFLDIKCRPHVCHQQHLSE